MKYDFGVEGEPSDNEAHAIAWAESAKVEYLRCRRFGHVWDEGSEIIQTIDRKHYGVSLECGRCHMRRIDVYRDKQYGPITRRYFTPNGYSMEEPAGEETSRRIPGYVIQEYTFAQARQIKATEEVRAVFEAWNTHSHERT